MKYARSTVFIIGRPGIGRMILKGGTVAPKSLVTGRNENERGRFPGYIRRLQRYK